MPRDAGYPDPSSSPRRPRVVNPRVGATLATEGLTPGKPPALSATPDLTMLLRALRRRWLLAFLLAVPMAAGVGYGLWRLTAPEHSAFSVLRVSATRQDLIDDRPEGRNEFNAYLRSQAAQLRGRPVLTAALNRDEVKRFNLEQQTPDPVLYLEERLKVDVQNDTELVRVYLSGPTPEAAVAMTQAVTEAFLIEVVEKDRKQHADQVATLDTMYNTQVGKLRTKKEQVRRLADELQTPDSETAKLKSLTSLANFNEAKRQHTEAKYRLLAAQTRLATHQAQKKAFIEAPVSEATVQEAIDADPQMQDHRSRVQKLQEVIKEYNRLVPDRSNPVRLKAERELREAQVKMEQRRAEIRSSLGQKGKQRLASDFDARSALIEGEIEVLKASEASFREEADRLAKETVRLGSSTAEKELLEREVARDEQLVHDIGSQLEKQRLGLQANARVTRYQQAVLLPQDPKKQILATGVGVFGTLVVVCGLVSYVEFRRRRIQSPDELSTGLGISVVGAVPATPHPERLVHATEETLASATVLYESVDAIRTLLLHNANLEATRVLMVTSAEYGEGKTTLASHLAGSLARAGRKTLLLDADLRRPALHQLFEQPLQPGFSEILMGEVDTPDAVQPTNLDGLWLLTAGQWDREVIQCLARDGVQGLLEKLKEEFDFIIIDTPPTLPSTDALMVGQNVDAVLLAVLHGVSQSPKVFAATQRLSSLNIRILGAVVNAMDPTQVLSNNLSFAAA